MIDISKDELAQDLIRKLGIESLSVANQQQVLEVFSSNLTKVITQKTLEAIPHGCHEEYLELLESGQNKKLYALITSYIPQYDEFVAKVTREEIAIMEERVTSA